MRNLGWIVGLCAVLGGPVAPAGTFRAGFGEVDITPPKGTPRQGWNSKLVGESALDPLFARAAAFQTDDDGPVVIIQLDVALVSAADTAAIRELVRKTHGIPKARVMVTATHNHSGPAMIDEALPRDERYIQRMEWATSEAVGKALAALGECEMAAGTAFEFDVATNRRILMRDGTVRTHGSFADPAALGFEGPIDPEVAVLAFKERDGGIRGVLVNFACHPTHHGGDPIFSAGYPGVVARELKARGIPVTLFLQGAAGNIAYDDPKGRPVKTMEEIGRILADDVMKALTRPAWSRPAAISAASKTLSVPYRDVTEADIKGTARGAQRFGEPGYYDRTVPPLVSMIREKKAEAAEVQVFRIGEVALAAQPSESFVEHGLRIKEATWPTRTMVVCYANGMLGYLPHEEAFRRGGYECTFGPPSRMAPRAGRDLADAAIDLITRVQARADGQKAGDEKSVAGVKLCWCQPGKFTMGSPPAEPERRADEAQVEVTLTRGFWIGKYEVTQGDWKRVVGRLPGAPTAELPEGDDLPVGNVNFAQAEAFCRKLTGQAHESGDLPEAWEFLLPTEAQWEYACRAGTTTATAFGDSLSRTQANFRGRPYNRAVDEGASLGKGAPVGRYPANAWGLRDMHGNTFEWCRDWYHSTLPGGTDPDLYEGSATATRNRDGTRSRVRRGGAWTDDGWACRSALRLRFEPERGYDHIGFRVVAVKK